MSAKVYPFISKREQSVIAELGLLDFSSIVQLRALLIERLVHHANQGADGTWETLEQIKGKSVVEQVVIILKTYPYMNQYTSKILHKS